MQQINALFLLLIFVSGSLACTIGCNFEGLTFNHQSLDRYQVLDAPYDGTISALHLSFLSTSSAGASVTVTVNGVPAAVASVAGLTVGDTSPVKFQFATPFTVQAGDLITFSVSPDAGFANTLLAYAANQDCLGSSSANTRDFTQDVAYYFEITCSSQTGGDPHFYGYKGQKYDVMGQSFEIYNIITGPTLQINSRFIPYYKTAEQALPTGTMMGEIGIKWFQHQFYVNANSTVAILDSQEISLASEFSIQLGEGAVLKNTANGRNYQFTLETADVSITFVRKLYTVVGLDAQWHFDYKSNLVNEKAALHGLLGQSREDKVFADKVGAFKFLDGSENDYRVRSNNIFGDDFKYNMYQNL